MSLVPSNYLLTVLVIQLFMRAKDNGWNLTIVAPKIRGSWLELVN